MKAPYVSLENAKEVNEYFSQVEPNRALMRTLHFVMGRFINATTVFDEGAERQIKNDLSEGRQIFLAHNHQSFYDPLVLASMLQREKALRPMRTRTVIPGKSPEFNHPLYGWVVRNSGAIPVFRKAEFNGDASQDEARRQANNSQVTIMQAHMNRGKHGAIYPEGTRGKDEADRDPTRLLPLHEGIGRIACGLQRPDNVRIVCVGTIFTGNRKALSVVAQPFEVPDTVEEVVSMTGTTLQQAVNAAAHRT